MRCFAQFQLLLFKSYFLSVWCMFRCVFVLPFIAQRKLFMVAKMKVH